MFSRRATHLELFELLKAQGPKGRHSYEDSFFNWRTAWIFYMFLGVKTYLATQKSGKPGLNQTRFRLKAWWNLTRQHREGIKKTNIHTNNWLSIFFMWSEFLHWYLSKLMPDGGWIHQLHSSQPIGCYNIPSVLKYYQTECRCVWFVPGSSLSIFNLYRLLSLHTHRQHTPMFPLPLFPSCPADIWTFDMLVPAF